MIIHNVQQGSPEWLTLRSGIPTASRFSDIITKSGKPSQSSERYMYTLLAERLMGHPIAEHMSMWQQRGSQLEADAIRFYELQVDADTEPIGFVTSDDGRYGASPDRFVVRGRSWHAGNQVPFRIHSRSGVDAIRNDLRDIPPAVHGTALDYGAQLCGRAFLSPGNGAGASKDRAR